MAMKCPDCGADNLDKAKFCSSCGRSLAVVPSGSSVGYRTCVSCGRMIDWNAVFCQHCGKDYRQPETRVETGPKRTGLPVVGGIFTILGGIGCLIIFAAIVIWNSDPSLELNSLGYFVLLISPPFGAIAIAGGALAIARRHHLIAVAGAALSILGFGVPGIIGLILTALSRKEFT